MITEARKQWLEKNKEQLKKYQKQYRENNKERIVKLNQEWHKTNPDKNKEYKCKYRNKNKDILNAKERERYHNNIKYEKERNKLYRQNNPEKCCERAKRWCRNNPEKAMFNRAKERAKRKGIEFTIILEDIIIPSHCPILGFPLIISSGKTKDNSPSLDRIDSDKGYIPTNIIVISQKANRIKSNATPDEIMKVAKFLKFNSKFNYQEL